MNASTPPGSVGARLTRYDWGAIHAELDGTGYACLPQLLHQHECLQSRECYAVDALFRSKVVMSRYNFGRGEYKYFAYPLPALVTQLRAALYTCLVPLANRWSECLRSDVRYPEALVDFTARCHHAGQLRPTALLLQYRRGDYNCLHQDLYGEHVFPLQVVILLSQPDREFKGGEFVLTEQRPRMQSKAEVVQLRQGDAVAFAVHDRPVRGARGTYRVKLRHGVSRIREGRRSTLGIIFHDAV